MKPVKVSDDGQIAIIIALEKEQVVAMLLNEKSRGQVLAGSNIADNLARDTGIRLGFGAKVQSPTSSGSLDGIVNEMILDLSDIRLSKAPFNRAKLVK